MKLSHVLGAAGLFILAACNPRGGVDFNYVLLIDNGAGEVIAADSCGTVNVDTVRYAVGNDLNGDLVLDATEELDVAEVFCNQNDANGDGTIVAEELGNVFFSRQIDVGTFDFFSISFLDAAGNFVPWAQAPVQGEDIFSFAFQNDDGTFTRNDVNTLNFGGVLDGELQVFIGF